MGTEFDRNLVRAMADRFQQHTTNLILDHIDIKDEFDPMDKKKQMKINDIQEVAERVAAKTREKHMSYGGALDVSHLILNVLYPDGVLTGQFFEFEVVSRIIEKLCRITRGNPVAYGESPWEDIIGYSLLAHKEFHNKEMVEASRKKFYEADLGVPFVEDDEDLVPGEKREGCPAPLVVPAMTPIPPVSCGYKEKNDVND